MLVFKQFASEVKGPKSIYDWLEVGILLATFLIQIPLILNADLGWLLTVCEKMLAGQRLYVDVLELNPPLSVYIYLPAAFVGQVLSVPAHIVVIIMTMGLAYVSAVATCQLLDEQAGALARQRVRCILLFCMLILPGATFGQREHIAVLLLVPFVALAGATMGDRAKCGTGTRAVVGLSAGIAMSIKPHFVFITGLPLLWNAVRARSLRPALGVEVWAAAAFVLAFYAGAYLLFPEFFHTFARWAATVYVPMRMPLTAFVSFETLYVLIWWAVMLWIVRGADRKNWQNSSAWFAAMLGGYLSYIIQGKNFAYIRLPMVEFAALSVLLAPGVLHKRLPRGKMVEAQIIILVLSIVQLGAWLLPLNNSHSYLKKPLAEIGPARPRLLAVTSNVGIGEPLTHKIAATWISGSGAQLLSGSAIWMLAHNRLSPPEKAVAEQIMTFERGRLRRELLNGKPDIILFDTEALGMVYDWEVWARADPLIAAELDNNYRFRRKVKRIEIWSRKVPQTGSPRSASR